EFVTHFVSDVRDDADPAGGSVHIHCTDVAGEWTLLPGDPPAQAGEYVVTREHSKCDCAMRGSASDLLLVLWRRIGIDQI
ncbi:MAG TPA: hypothetical protein PLV68_15105, partial [Ilumatobacteraceae bacterium]|nr:hypothetical protein [Ilumatobacteraceae bacterium]